MRPHGAGGPQLAAHVRPCVHVLSVPRRSVLRPLLRTSRAEPTRPASAAASPSYHSRPAAASFLALLFSQLQASACLAIGQYLA